MTSAIALPSAEAVAAAIIKACRLCGENPIDIIDRKFPSRARFYAYVALRNRYPHVLIGRMATLCGAKPGKTGSLIASASAATRSGWWDASIFAQVRIAIDEVLAATPSKVPARGASPKPRGAALPKTAGQTTTAAKPAEPPAPTDGRVEIIRPTRTAPIMSVNPIRHRQHHRSDAVLGMVGDPPPGRSALDQGYRAGGGLMKERDR